MKNKTVIISTILGILLVGSIAGTVILVNQYSVAKESLSGIENELSTAQTELDTADATLERLEEQFSAVSDTNLTIANADEVPEIDTTLTGDSILSSGLSLKEAWAFYNEAKKNNEELGLSAEETSEFINNLIFDLGTTLAQLEYSEKAGMFNEQQQVAQAPTTSKPTQQQPAKTSEPVKSSTDDIISKFNYYHSGIGTDGKEWGRISEKTKQGELTNWYERDSEGNFVVFQTKLSVYDSYDSYEDIPDEYKDLFTRFSDGSAHKIGSGIYEFYEDIPDNEKISAYPRKDIGWKVVGMYSVASKSSFSKSAESVYSTYDDIPSFLRHAYDQHEDGKWYKNSYWQGH